MNGARAGRLAVQVVMQMGVSVGDDGRRWWSSGVVGRTVTVHVDISEEGKRRHWLLRMERWRTSIGPQAHSHSLQHAANPHTLHTTLNHFFAQMACVPASHAQPLGCAGASIDMSLVSHSTLNSVRTLRANHIQSTHHSTHAMAQLHAAMSPQPHRSCPRQQQQRQGQHAMTACPLLHSCLVGILLEQGSLGSRPTTDCLYCGRFEWSPGSTPRSLG
jgi:hypothetical protein